ncbi:MAG: hypothetical protein LQ347_006271, partial [Umbilicaria vellea]
MADQHENKSATSPTSTPLLSPTTSFVSSHTLAERPSFEIAERSQGVPFQTHCQQVSPDSSENAIPTEDRRPDLLQASNSVEPGRPNINPPIFLLTSNVASGAPEDPSSLVSSPPALHKPEPQSSRVLRAQSLKSLPSASSFRVPTKLSSLRSDTSAATDSFDTDLRPQTSVPAFLGRHRTSQNAKSVQRAVSLGSIAELHSTAQQAYRNRTFSLPLAQQRRLSSLGERQKLSNSSLIRSRNAAITSVEDLRAPNDAALFIDIAKASDLDVLFPSPSPRHHPIPLCYRCSNPARPSTASKQAVYVPLFVNQRLRPATTSSMFFEPAYNYRVVKNGVSRPHGRTESTEELLGTYDPERVV